MRRSDHSALGAAIVVASTALVVLSDDARADEPSPPDASERSSRIRFTAWSWIGGDGRAITSPNDEPKALVTYYETQAARFIECPSEFEATDEARAACFAEQGPGALVGFRETLAESTDATIVVSLGRWLGNPGRWNERHVAMLRLYDSVVNAEGFDAALAAVEAGRGSLDEESFFVSTLNTRPPGLETSFSVQLADGTPVLRGLCVVMQSWGSAANPFKTPGVRLGIKRLTANSMAVFEQLLLTRSGAKPPPIPTATVPGTPSPVAALVAAAKATPKPIVKSQFTETAPTRLQPSRVELKQPARPATAVRA